MPQDLEKIELPKFTASGLFPHVGPETLKKIAKQSRPLTETEQSKLKALFGNVLDPSNIRIGYDSSLDNTNLRGYVLHKNLPTIAFFPTDKYNWKGELPDSFFHEFTHVWQQLAGENPRNAEYDAYAVGDSNQKVINKIRQKPTSNISSMGEMAFLESLDPKNSKSAEELAIKNSQKDSSWKYLEEKDGQINERDTLELLKMQQNNANLIPLETPKFNVRTGAPQKVSSSKTLEISDVKTIKGKWLKDKLQSLYSDPKYKTASPEQQKAWKSLAYAKWVNPYYKQVLKTNAPTKEDWLTGSTHSLEGTEVKERPIEGAYKRTGKEIGLHTMKTTTDITAGLFRNVADGLEYLDKATLGSTGESAKVVRQASQFISKKGEEWQGRIEDVHNNKEVSFKNDVPGKMAELGTQAIFFEATGAAKAAKLFNVANPKTAGLALQMARASWNGTVDFAAWSASQGEKPSEIGTSVISGAVVGGAGKLVQRKGLDPLFGMLKDLYKWGGKDVTQHTISEALVRISDTELKISSPLSEQSRKASTIAAVELDKYSVEKFKRPFKDLGYIQKQHVLNKLLAITVDAAKSAKTEGMPKQLIQAQAKEQNELMAAIFPEAKASQQKVEEFVKQSGLEPQSTKLLATLPHHNTTIDSPWKHLQARASFLRNKARQAKGEEHKTILQAYNEEFALMKEKAAREKAKNKGTVGGAAANDPKAFHGESFVVTPYIDPYNTGFGDWRADSFAQGVAQMARQQAAAKGSARSFMTDAIDNSFMVGANLSKKAFLQEGTTKQLLHDQFGIVGGINYQMERAYNLGENSGFKPNDSLLFINWLSMRPNVVARVWNVPGGGQTLFLHAAQEAERTGAGIALIPYDASKSFYEKMGMHEVGSYMAMTHTEVQNLLKNKGLLMMLLGAGITYGASKELTHGDYSVKGVN